MQIAEIKWNEYVKPCHIKQYNIATGGSSSKPSQKKWKASAYTNHEN
jgi:hypothetical protein